MELVDSSGPMGGITHEAYERIQQGEARTVNIEAGQAIAETVRTTLGPRGMDKMLVDSLGAVVITNDGATILRELDFTNPAAKMVAEVAKAQELDIGDGTTTSVILTGALLKEAQSLFEEGLHPKTVIDGYQRAHARAHERLTAQATEVDTEDTETLKQVVTTAMTGKAVSGRRDELVADVVNAIRAVEQDGIVDIDSIVVETIVGGSTDETELLDGTVIEQTPAHPSMPRACDDARVAILDTHLEPGNVDLDTNITIANTAELNGFTDDKIRRAKYLTQGFIDADVDILFVAEDIDDYVVEYLAQNDIIAASQTPDEAIERLATATGAHIVSKVDAFEPENCGYTGHFEIADIDQESHFFVEECAGNLVTLLVRGGTVHVQEEIRRNIADAISALTLAIEGQGIVLGGGSLEIGVASDLRAFATSVGSREQLAIEAFADALETIPRTLAETAGMDPIDAIIQLRREHAAGVRTAGIDVTNESIRPISDISVVEPLEVMSRALETAVDATTMLLRIDDIFESEELPDETNGVMDMPR